jgi:hypothetical protein
LSGFISLFLSPICNQGIQCVVNALPSRCKLRQVRRPDVHGEGEAINEAAVFLFLLATKGNHGISSVVNSREGMSQIEPGSQPDAGGGVGGQSMRPRWAAVFFFLFCFAGRSVGEGTRARASFCCGPDTGGGRQDLCNLDTSCTLLHFSLAVYIYLVETMETHLVMQTMETSIRVTRS